MGVGHIVELVDVDVELPDEVVLVIVGLAVTDVDVVDDVLVLDGPLEVLLLVDEVLVDEPLVFVPLVVVELVLVTEAGLVVDVVLSVVLVLPESEVVVSNSVVVELLELVVDDGLVSMMLVASTSTVLTHSGPGVGSKFAKS